MKSLMDLIKEQDEIIKDINNVRQSGPITIDNVQGIIEKHDQIDNINTEIKNMINTNWHSDFMDEVANWFGVKPIDDILKKNVELVKELPTIDKDDVIVLKSIDNDVVWKPIMLFGKLVMAHRVLHQKDFQVMSKEVELAYDSTPVPLANDMQVLIVSVNNKTGETIMRKSCYKTYSMLNHTGYKHIMIVSNSSIPYDETYEITVKPEDVCEDIRKHIPEFYPKSVSRYLKYEGTLASTEWDIPLDRVIPYPEKDVTPDIVEYLKDGEWKPIKIFGKTGIAHIVIGLSEHTTLSNIIYDAVKQYKYVFNYSELLIEINNKTKYMTFVTNLKNLGNPDYTYIVFGCDFDPPVSKSNVVDILPEDIHIDIESLGEEMINDPKQYYDPMYLKTNGAWMIPFPRIHNTDDIAVKVDETVSTPTKKHRLFISQPFTGFDDTVIMQQRAHLFDIYCAYKGYDKSDVELIENHLPDDPYDIDENFSSQDERNLYRFCRSIGMLGKATDIIFYGEIHKSRGCRLEFDICSKYSINIIHQAELFKFCKTTPGFEHFVDELWTKPWGMCWNVGPHETMRKGINTTLDSFCDKIISDPIFNGSYKRSGSLRKITLGEKIIDIVLAFDEDLDSWLIFIGDRVKPRILIKTNGDITEDIRVPIPEPLLCRDIQTLCVMLEACKNKNWQSKEDTHEEQMKSSDNDEDISELMKIIHS